MPTRGVCPQRTVGPLAGTYPTSQAASRWARMLLPAPAGVLVPELTDCAGKRAFGNRVAAWPKLAPDGRFGYI